MKDFRFRLGSGFALGLVLLLVWGTSIAAAAGNDAAILVGGSSVPTSAAPGSTISVAVRVQNTGTNTWSSGAAYRLGASPSNQVPWSGYACGGYINSPTDIRVFLCHDVAPGGTHDFHFNVTLPASGTARLSVRMVQDGVEWFGQMQSWDISIGGSGGLPDVVVESVQPDPSSPQAGQSVRFISVVRNQGATSTPSGTVIGVGYFIDGGYVTFGTVNGPLGPGASTTITTQGGLWAATSGSHQLMAFVDDINRFPESDENNNTRSATFTVGGGCANSSLPTPSDRWKLEIFNNRTLSGSSVEQRYDVAGPTGFTFNWGSGGPSSCAGSDNFGVRFSRSFSLPTAGNYTFTVTADDGVRLWVDGQLLVDRWIDQAPTTYQATRSLAAGSHDIRMDYYENGGGAYAALAWAPQSSGGAAELYGINIDPANPSGNPTPQQLRDAGVRWVRIEWKLDPGYSFYDSRIADYRNAGIRVLLLIDYSSVPPKPASNASDAEWTAYLQRFNSSLRDLASHYGDGVDAWQIWNEPDLMAPGSAYDPGVPARFYGVMLRDAVTTIRAYSSRPIVTGGLASGNANYLAQARDAVGGLTVDAVAVHPYGQRAPDNWPNASWGFGNMSDLFNRYLAFGKPLWVTEIGINDPNTSLHAQYLENVYRLARDQYGGRVQRVFWFCWSDGMVAPFGLLDTSGNPKDTYDRYRAIAPPW